MFKGNCVVVSMFKGNCVVVSMFKGNCVVVSMFKGNCVVYHCRSQCLKATVLCITVGLNV